MQCSRCGKVSMQDAHFCSGCGAPAGFVPAAGPMYAAPMAEMRVTRHLQVLGTLWMVYAGIRTLTGLGSILFLHGVFGSHVHGHFGMGWSPFGREWAGALLPMAFFSLMTSVACTVLTGYGLLTRQPWGRIVAIIFAIFALIHFPLGTALGIFTLWTMAPRRSGDEYAALAYAGRQRP